MDLKEFAAQKADYISTMHENNAKIRDYALKEQESIEELIKVNEKMELIEIFETDKIVNAVKEDGKQKYTNDTQRKSALFVVLQDHAEYQDLKNKKRELGRNMGLAKIEKEYTERKLRIMEKIF